MIRLRLLAFAASIAKNTRSYISLVPKNLINLLCVLSDQFYSLLPGSLDRHVARSGFVRLGNNSRRRDHQIKVGLSFSILRFFCSQLFILRVFHSQIFHS